MALPPFLADMIGEDLANAVDTAQTRLSDATITVRCEATHWLIERAGVAVETGLSHDACVAALGALT